MLDFPLHQKVESVTDILFSKDGLPGGKIRLLGDARQAVKLLDAGLGEEFKRPDELSLAQGGQTGLG
jgi:hypothetical protein